MKTILIKLNCSNIDKSNLINLLKEKQKCFNFLSSELFKLDNYNSYLNIKKLHDKFYYDIKSHFPDILSQIVIKVEQEVIATYKSIKSNKHKIQEAPKQKNYALQLDKRLYSSMTNTSIKLPFRKGERRVKCDYVLYDRAIQFLNNNTAHDPKLCLNYKNELILAIPFDVASPVVSNEEVLGIDLGIRCLASCSDGRVYQGKDYKKEKRRLKYLKRCLQSKHTKSSYRHLKKISRKIHNYSKNAIHQLTNQILNTDKDIIVLEDLKGIKENTKNIKGTNIKRTQHNRSFGDIPVYMIVTYLTYKASHLGKMVVTVNPSFTSQKDCRGKSNGERVGRRYYTIDNKQLDADVNASVNIANSIDILKHPISYPDKVTYIGRVLSTTQS